MLTFDVDTEPHALQILESVRMIKFAESGASPYVVHIPTEITALEEAFEKYHDRLNCVLVEPLLQGAGGMRMYDVSFLKKARELCDQYGVLLVFDEVATGFGRTGNRFVADLVLPDILVLGKALTGGYIGHAATVANRKVFEYIHYQVHLKEPYQLKHLKSLIYL